MKKALAIILSAAMILSFAACGEKKTSEAPKQDLIETGRLALSIISEDEMNEKLEGEHITYFDTLSSMIMALTSGRIQYIVGLPDIVGRYIDVRNANIESTKPKQNGATIRYHMGTLKSTPDIYELFENAIVEMTEDRTLERLAEEYITAYIDTEDEPDPIELPKIEGARNIRVAITGDLPPIDFMDENGVPAGYNIALLSEISKRANINIEPVIVDSGAKVVALSAGAADVAFWISDIKPDGPNTIFPDGYIDATDDVMLTSVYYASQSCVLNMAE